MWADISAAYLNCWGNVCEGLALHLPQCFLTAVNLLVWSISNLKDENGSKPFVEDPEKDTIYSQLLHSQIIYAAVISTRSLNPKYIFYINITILFFSQMAHVAWPVLTNSRMLQDKDRSLCPHIEGEEAIA